jgi:hypothetical protein
VTPEEAVKVASLIGELWPQADMTGTRKTFYANALTTIDRPDAAIRAVNQLFVTQRWQPTPADVIDLAIGSRSQADQQWRAIVDSASQAQSRTPITGPTPDRVASRIVYELCGGLQGVPVDDMRQLDRLRDRFINTYTEKRRATTLKELTSGTD